MKSFNLCLTTQSPVLLSEGPPAHNLIKTLDFIPGNTVRGLLAQRYLDSIGTAEDEYFQCLFLSGEARFGFARIEGYQTNSCQTIPISARSCKYNGGFVKNNGDPTGNSSNQENHGLVDFLLAKEKDKPSANDKDNHYQCPKCNQPVDYFEGFYDPATCIKHTIKKRLITRTAIDPVLGTASAGRLYSQQVIAEGQLFYTVVEVPDEMAEDFNTLISKPFTARIGTGRSRGQGWIEVKEARFTHPAWGEAGVRFNQFRQKIGQPILAVTFLSDAVFHDDFLRDCTAPNTSDLHSLGINPNDWEPGPYQDKAFVATRLVFGFDGIPLQLPRAPRLAVSAGSVLLYKAKERITPHIPDGEGLGWVGDGNREGFGQALLWHPFHLDPEKEIDHE